MLQINLLQSRNLLWEALKTNTLPDYLLYMSDGGRSWIKLHSCRGFTVSRDLTLLLTQNLSILNAIQKPLTVLALGVGSGEKEKKIIDYLTASNIKAYVAQDVNPELSAKALEDIDCAVDKVSATCLLEQLPELRKHLKPPFLITMLGNTFSNFHPPEVFNAINQTTASGDYFLLDFHLLESERQRQEILDTYGSAENRDFNLSPLIRCKARQADLKFRLQLIEVETPHGKVLRTNKEIQVLEDTTLDVCGQKKFLGKNTLITLGFTYKYRLSQAKEIPKKFGYEVCELIPSEDQKNLLMLCKRK